jgi:porphobilinogen synthase
VHAVLLFGIPEKVDSLGKSAYLPGGIVQKATRAVKKEFGDSIVVFTDVCLCAYLPHGHCGVVKGRRIDDDVTNILLAKIAVSHACAGADFVAPSAMSDGQVKAIRRALDQKGFYGTGILSYSVKYASHFYGPFREAMDSAPQFGDRKSYQMEYANGDEALREALEDVREGADMLMVKPAMPYLDVIYRIRREINAPLAAYHVSGEYAMIKKAAQNGLLDEQGAVLEALGGIKRAGADLIITYYAGEAAKWLKESR